ncbi:MAG: hypothetical protein WEA99_14295 [Brumimicrobium sp.]
MITINPQYINDNTGKKMVVLLKKEFDLLMEMLDELEDIRVYDEVKKNDDGKRIKFSDYLKKRKDKNA